MLHEGSRYLSTFPYRTGKGIVSLSRRRRKKYDKSKCAVYTVIQGDTLDGLSTRIYGLPQLWWAILDANPQYQSELDVKAGDIILIPNFDEVVNSE